MMKLRVRINRQTCRVELPGEEPGVTELIHLIKETLLSAHGLSAETEFSLSLNGSELLSDSGQTLAACGIVSGDLISVILPESAAANSTNSTSSNNRPPCSTDHQRREQIQEAQQTAAMTASQPGSSGVSSSSSSGGSGGGGGGGGSSGGGSSGGGSSSSTTAVTEPEETFDMSDSEPSVSSWEPMLCSEAEDGQAPLSLELLYHSAQTTAPSDAIMVAGHLLMLETGFVPQGGKLKASEMPAGWRSAAGLYKLQYSHPLCESSLAMVVAVCMGPELVVNATLKMDQTVDTVTKLCLKPSSHVTNEWPGESAAAAFKDLSKLSRVFKDQLAYPLIAAAREAMALPVAFGLAALPPELLLRVLRLLDVRSVVRLSSVCRHFNTATADSTLWRHLYRRDFADSDASRPRDTDWKELYKRFYKLRCERRHARHRSLPPFPRNPRDIFNPYPLFPPLPGIIGGEYDQRPNLLPRPRYDPIGPLQDHSRRPLSDLRRVRPPGGRPADVRRGFI